jgi:hypothetical protein
MSSSKTLASILGSEEADALECWLSNKEPPDTLTGWIEENAYRRNQLQSLFGASGCCRRGAITRCPRKVAPLRHFIS